MVVVVPGVLGENCLEVAMAEDEYVVEAFTPERADHAPTSVLTTRHQWFTSVFLAPAGLVARLFCNR
jgi:hypothetical protein